MKIFYNGLNYSTRALVDIACEGSITMKTVREANLMFKELAKISDGRKQGGMHEVDRISSLEAKFEALMMRLNQQALKEPTQHICKHKVLLWIILHFKLRMQTM